MSESPRKAMMPIKAILSSVRKAVDGGFIANLMQNLAKTTDLAAVYGVNRKGGPNRQTDVLF